MKNQKNHPNDLPASMIADWPRNSIIREDGRSYLAFADEVMAYSVAGEYGCEVTNLIAVPGWFGVAPKI